MKKLLLIALAFISARNVITAKIVYLPETQNDLPQDISFCIADLKFDGTNIQLCELGEGLESRFKGYDAITYQGAMWEALWNALGAYKMPIFVIENDFWHQHTADFAYPALRANQGFITRSLGKGQRGIYIIHSLKKSIGAIKRLAAQNPAQFFLGCATTRFVKNKQETNALFDTPFLQQFKPQNLLIKKHYYPDLADDILQTIISEYLVIKPTNSSLGYGILIVHRNELHATLKTILLDHAEILKKHHGDKGYSYWLKDHSSHFIVEAFAQSKPLIVKNKTYDATMRVAFLMSNIAGKMRFTYLGAYWKLPAKDLSQPASFTEKHKSATTSDPGSSVSVADEDFITVCSNLNQLLPELYRKMLLLN
jgi:hypothetical protein